MKFKTPLILCLIAVALTACGKTSEAPKTQDTPSSSTTSTSTDVNANAPTVQQTLDKVGDTILSDKTFRGCIARNVQSCSSEIISQYSRGDTAEVCKNFKDPTLIITCTSAVTIELARKNTDPALCNTLTEPSKTSCTEQAITAKALKAWDIALCGEIEALVSTDTGNVTSLGEGPRDRCRQQVIRSSPTSTAAEKLCATLEFEPSRTMCTQEVSRRRDMEKQMEKTWDTMEPNISTPLK